MEFPTGICGGVREKFLVSKCYFWIKKAKLQGFLMEYNNRYTVIGQKINYYECSLLIKLKLGCFAKPTRKCKPHKKKC